MVEPVIKTPWNTEMSPDEMREYYDSKIEAQKRECKRDGCDDTARFPRKYCSYACNDYSFRKAWHDLTGEGPEPTPPEDVPQRTPHEMQKVIESFKRQPPCLQPSH